MLSSLECVRQMLCGTALSAGNDLIAVISPGITTLNIGDQIISEAVALELHDLFPQKYLVPFSSHAGFRKNARNLFNRCSLRFWGGANMLDHRLLPLNNYSPDIPLLESFFFEPSLLLGVGNGNCADQPFNSTARLFYKRMLSRSGLHSVRDRKTLSSLRELGFDNVICTGCPTTWRLTPEKCRRIPVERAADVIFTLTDYRTDPEADRNFVRLLEECYSHLCFFPQGAGDIDYLKGLGLMDGRITCIPSSLSCFDAMLSPGKVDYVGTRLHGGIRAMQKGCRALILGIDNRAADIRSDIDLPMVFRGDAAGIRNRICNPEPCVLKIDFDAIEAWKRQFR